MFFNKSATNKEQEGNNQIVLDNATIQGNTEFEKKDNYMDSTFQ